MVAIQSSPTGVTFAVKLHPRAKKNGVTGEVGDALKLSLTAPPVDGKANAACIRFFADLAGVPQSHVRIVLGLSNRTKVIEIDGPSQQALETKMEGGL